MIKNQFIYRWLENVIFLNSRGIISLTILILPLLFKDVDLTSGVDITEVFDMLHVTTRLDTLDMSLWLLALICTKIYMFLKNSPLFVICT